MDALKRYATLLLAAAGGITAAVGYGFLTWPTSQAASKALPKDAGEMEKMAAVFEVCVVFFATTYLSGWGWERLLRARELADEIRRNASWHLKFLFFFSALLGAQRWWFARGRGFGRLDDWVAVAFAAAFGLTAIAFEISRLRRAKC